MSAPSQQIWQSHVFLSTSSDFSWSFHLASSISRNPFLGEKRARYTPVNTASADILPVCCCLGAGDDMLFCLGGTGGGGATKKVLN